MNEQHEVVPEEWDTPLSPADKRERLHEQHRLGRELRMETLMHREHMPEAKRLKCMRRAHLAMGLIVERPPVVLEETHEEVMASLRVKRPRRHRKKGN